ncbi:predicted protein [Lentinula edodes]|uniref:Uncharacterized protein n=1 Tax=Lentinula edodes TaxID=5353 RepID=A0A1Q3ERP3_LENED|nr:predicted protein [Lentinula edodes]
MLAELKMHVRDEQLAAQTAKHHLKHHFGQARDEGNEVVQTSATQQPSQPQNPVAGASSHSDDPDLEVEDEFQELTSSLTAMANDDEISDNLEFPSELSIPLGSLFDFTSKSWVDIHNISAVRSLDEELEFYELVDADGNGGAGIDVAVDEALNCLL